MRNPQPKTYHLRPAIDGEDYHAGSMEEYTREGWTFYRYGACGWAAVLCVHWVTLIAPTLDLLTETIDAFTAGNPQVYQMRDVPR